MRYLIGTYTRGTSSEGIYRFDLDPSSGALSEPRLVTRADNPSWLTTNQERVVVANEFADGENGGEISAYLTQGEGLTLESRVPSMGADPCHLAIGTGLLACANFSGGTVALYQWNANGIGALQTVLVHERTGLHPRQRSAHPHGVYFLDEYLLVPDLGGDRVFRYRVPSGDPAGFIQAPSGSGPRHLAAGGRYLVNELDNTVVEIEDGAVVAVAATLPEDSASPSATAEILQVGDRLYVSNRGADSISVFDADLNLVEHSSTYGRHPRHFSIDPDRRWLVVANKDSNNLVCLPVEADGRLGRPVAERNCPSPVCLTEWPSTDRAVC
jgi:6-phosphogluconolactonase